VNLVARSATLADSKLLLAWRNDPLTREHSRVPGMVTPDEHDQWLTQVLHDQSRRLFIVELDESNPVGTVRFDSEFRGTFEVSLTVNPELRGQKYGTSMLLCAEQELQSQTSVAALRAFIKDDNVASIRLFESAGFLRDQDSWWEKRLDTDA
jgi:RimJ/RimL family protein N-acetyltransferase